MIALNLSDIASFIRHNRRSVQIHFVINDQERVIRIHHVVVNWHTVQVLLEQVLKEEVLLLQSRFLLLDGEFVEVDLIEAFVEVVEHFVLLESFFFIETGDLLNIDIGLIHCVGVWLVERQDFFFFSFEFSAQLRGFEYLLA